MISEINLAKAALINTQPTPLILSARQPSLSIAISSICAGLLILAALPQSAKANQPATSSTEKKQTFAISAGSLSDSLLALSQATGQKVLFDANLVRGLSSQGLKGQYSPQQALQTLLIGTGLQAKTTDSGSISLEKSPNPSSSQLLTGTTILPTIKVIGKTIYDVKDPYNEDYVLPNATAGTKTDTPIMETPLNIQVISKQVLKDQQVIRLDQALNNVSGVTTDSFSNYSFGGTDQTITLRGFASSTYLRNGFRLQEGAGQREMANVESVEVLKGAAAILYGMVDPGGMVNVTTKQPLATPYYAFNQQFGSYNLYRTTIDTTGPVSNNKDVLYRMNISYENSGSFRDYVNNDKLFLDPILKWNLSARTQATIELEYSHENIGLDYQFDPTYNGQFIKIPRNLNYSGPNSGTNKNDHIFGGFNWSHQFNDDWSIKHGVSISQNNVNRVGGVVPFSPQISPNGNQVAQVLYNYDSLFNTYATNIDLTGHFNTGWLKHTLLLGGDYYRKESPLTRLSSFANFNNYPAGLTFVNIFNPALGATGLTLDPNSFYSSYQTTDQYGLYLQDQIKLPYNVHFTGGMRYQYYHEQTGGQDNSVPQVFDTTKLTADKVTPRFGLLWRAQSWLSLYSNYVESFGPNYGTIYPSTPVPPSGAQQWEVGAKTEFFNGRLRATMAYYDLTKTNIATGDPNPAHSGSSIVTGAVRSRGPELDIQGEIMQGWNVIATYTNTDIVVTSSNDPYPAQGSRYYGIPRNMGSFWNTYDFQSAVLTGFKIGGGVTLRDSQLAWTGGGPDINIPGYATVNLLAAYSMKVGKSKVTAQLNINNLLDKYYLTGGTFAGPPVTNGFDGGYVGFGAPRTLMGSIRVEF